MELSHPFTCDVCGVHKGEQNHWFRVWAARFSGGNAVMMATWDCQTDIKHCHCCGEEHALRKAGELLGGIGLGGPSGE